MPNYSTSETALQRYQRFIAATGAVTNTSYRSYVRESRSRTGTSGSSPRVNGKIALRANACDLTKVITKQQPAVHRNGAIVGYTQPGLIPIVEVRESVFLPLNYLATSPGLPPESLAVEAGYIFRSRVNEQKVLLAVLFAELTKSVNLIAQKVSSIATAIRLARKGKWGQAAKRLGTNSPPPPRRRKRSDNGSASSLAKGTMKTFSERWLEWHYGWLPLYNDIYGMLAAMETFAPQPWVRATASRSFSYQEIFSGSGYSATSVCKVRQRVTVAASVKVTDWSAIKMHEYGVTGPQAAVTVWELIPFSFVVDWFVPVGAYLEAKAALTGVKLENASTTYNTHSVITTTVKPVGQFVSIQTGIGVRETFRKKRVLGIPAASFPYSQLELNPFYGEQVTKKFFHAVALLGAAWTGSSSIKRQRI